MEQMFGFVFATGRLQPESSELSLPSLLPFNDLRCFARVRWWGRRCCIATGNLDSSSARTSCTMMVSSSFSFRSTTKSEEKDRYLAPIPSG